MGVLAIRLSKKLEKELENEIKLENKSRSELVREALEEFLRRRQERRFMGQMIREMRGRNPGQVQTDLSVAEETMPYDNEALDSGAEESEEKWWR